MKNLPVLEGEHIIMGRFAPEHFDVYHKWMQDGYIISVTDSDRGITLEDVSNMFDEFENSDDVAHFLIFDKATNVPVGDADLRDIKMGESAESVIMIAEASFRGKGYASEAYKLLLDFAFSHLSLKKVVAFILEINTPSIRLHEKLGFVRVGKNKNELVFEFHNPHS